MLQGWVKPKGSSRKNKRRQCLQSLQAKPLTLRSFACDPTDRSKVTECRQHVTLNSGNDRDIDKLDENETGKGF